MRGRFKHDVSRLIPLDGGIDEYHDGIDVADNRKLSAENIHIDGGKLKKRPGKRLWSTIDFVNGFKGVEEYIDPNGVSRLLVASDGNIYETDKTAKTSRDTVTNERIRFNTFRGRCWYNGENTQRKITYTTAARVGIVAPTIAPTLSASGTGLTGSYFYKYTYCIKESGVVVWESDPSPAGDVISLSNEGATVTVTVSTDARVNCRKIYRTTAGGATYQLDGEIDDNTTLTYASGSITDAELGAVLETNHGVPVQGSVSQGASDRMFWIDGYKLRYSEMAHTESYLEYQRATNFVELPKYGLGTAMKSIYNTNTDKEDLYIFQTDSTSVLPGADPLQSLLQLSTIRGCIAQETIVEWNKAPIFVSNQNTVEIVSGSRLVDITSRNIPKTMADLISLDQATASLIYGNYYVLCCQDKRGLLYNHKVLVCDLRTIREVQPGMADATWYVWNLNAEYIYEKKDGTVLMLDNQENRIFELRTDLFRDTDKDGTQFNITASFRTKDFSYGLFGRMHPRVLIVKGNQKDDMTVTPYYGDQYSGHSSTTFNAPPGTPFIMGQSVMGSPLTSIPLRIEGTIPAEAVGIWCGFQFVKENYDEFFNLSFMQFSYTLYQRI